MSKTYFAWAFSYIIMTDNVLKYTGLASRYTLGWIIQTCCNARETAAEGGPFPTLKNMRKEITTVSTARPMNNNNR